MALPNQFAFVSSTKKGAEAPHVSRPLVDFANLECHGALDHIDSADGEVHYAVIHQVEGIHLIYVAFFLGDPLKGCGEDFFTRLRPSMASEFTIPINGLKICHHIRKVSPTIGARVARSR